MTVVMFARAIMTLAINRVKQARRPEKSQCECLRNGRRRTVGES